MTTSPLFASHSPVCRVTTAPPAPLLTTRALLVRRARRAPRAPLCARRASTSRQLFNRRATTALPGTTAPALGTRATRHAPLASTHQRQTARRARAARLVSSRRPLGPLDAPRARRATTAQPLASLLTRANARLELTRPLELRVAPAALAADFKRLLARTRAPRARQVSTAQPQGSRATLRVLLASTRMHLRQAARAVPS